MPATKTLMFTDIVDSSAPTRRLGDKAYSTVLKQHNDRIREIVGSMLAKVRQ